MTPRLRLYPERDGYNSTDRTYISRFWHPLLLLLFGNVIFCFFKMHQLFILLSCVFFLYRNILISTEANNGPPYFLYIFGSFSHYNKIMKNLSPFLIRDAISIWFNSLYFVTKKKKHNWEKVVVSEVRLFAWNNKISRRKHSPKVTFLVYFWRLNSVSCSSPPPFISLKPQNKRVDWQNLSWRAFLVRLLSSRNPHQKQNRLSEKLNTRRTDPYIIYLLIC